MISAVRASVFTLVAFSFALPLQAQGWIIPRPCGIDRETDGRAHPSTSPRLPSEHLADAERRARRARRSRAQVRGRRALRQSRRERRRGGLSLSASGERRVSGSETLDQRRARLRRNDERRRSAPHLREHRPHAARSGARRVDGTRAAARANLSDQSRRGKAHRRSLPERRAARRRRAAHRLLPRRRARRRRPCATAARRRSRSAIVRRRSSERRSRRRTRSTSPTATDDAKRPCAATRATSRCSFPCGAARRRRSACCRMRRATKTASRSSP